MWSVCYSCPILSKIEFVRQRFLKITSKNFMIICPSEPEFSMRTDRHTNRRDEINSRF